MIFQIWSMAMYTKYEMSIERKTIKGKIWLQEDVEGKGRDQNTGGKK